MYCMCHAFILILNLKTPSVLDLPLHIADVLPCSSPAASHLPSLSCPHSPCFDGITRCLPGSSQPSRLPCALLSASPPLTTRPVLRSFSLGGGAATHADRQPSVSTQQKVRGRPVGVKRALCWRSRNRAREAERRVGGWRTKQDNEVKVCGGRRARRQQE